MTQRPCRWLGPLWLLAACTDPEPAVTRPPEACRDAASAGEMRFQDAADPLPAGVFGNRLGAADWDGDGWTDLWVARGDSGPRDVFPDGPRYRWLLRNLEGQGWEDVTESSGFSATRDGGTGRSWNFVLWGDLDGDQDTDAVTILHKWDTATLPDTGDRSEVLLNDGTGHFTLADEPVLDANLATASASLLDQDRDGRLDLWVANEYGTYGRPETAQQSLLLRGGGDGTFRDRTESVGLQVESGGSINPNNAVVYNEDGGAHVRWPFYGGMACDINGDGWTDVFGLTYGRGWNQIWLGGPDGFTNQTLMSGAGMDGNTDWRDNQYFLCHCQDHPAQTDCQGAAAPAINCPDGATWTPGWDDQPHRNGGNTFGGHCADLDGDLDLDLTYSMIHHWWAGAGSDSSDILWNDGSPSPVFTWADREEAGILPEHVGASWNEGDLNVAAFDLDDDGVLDLLRPQSDYPDQHLYLFRGLGDGHFADVTASSRLEMPRAAGMAVADFDGDGDLDVFTSFSRMRCDADCPWDDAVVRYFGNREAQERNSLNLRLLGTRANTTGIGARVTVEAGGRTQVQELMAGHGHQGLQNDTALHFGLGSACVADRVTVNWPDGSAPQVWEQIPANWPVTFAQDEAEPRWRGWQPGD